MSKGEQFIIRSIRKFDNQEVKKIILNSLEEYGANREGFAAKDPELKALSEFYSRVGGVYFVAERGNRILGGSGIAPLGGEEGVWELQKMYIDSGSRGAGIGGSLLKKCIESAREKGVNKLYIETLNSMKEANHLYQKFGFLPLDKPKGDTGHFGCDKYYLKDLD